MMLQGHITFSMPSSNTTPERWVEIKIADALSGTQFLRVKMSPETFAQATIGSLGYADCEFELFPANVGKMQEHKTELVPLGYEYTVDEKIAALAKFEVDGWKGYDRDIGNHHKRDKNNAGWYVTFTRFVEVGSEAANDTA